jgi:hypothetical protein
MTVPTYDYDQRLWKKIYGPEELSKIGELLTGIPAGEIIPVIPDCSQVIVIITQTTLMISLLLILQL